MCEGGKEGYPELTRDIYQPRNIPENKDADSVCWVPLDDYARKAVKFWAKALRAF